MRSQTSNLRASSHLIEKASVSFCHQYNSFSFDRIFLKLADKVEKNGISDKFENWLERIISLRVTSP